MPRGEVREIDGKQICAGFNFGNVTSNQAEYYALICALKRLLHVCDPEKTDVVVYGDSKLVIKQVKGTWRVNRRHLYAPMKEVRDLLKNFHSYKLKWKPRRKNQKADRLSKTPGTVENAFPWVEVKIAESDSGTIVSFPFEAPLIPSLKKQFRGAVWNPEEKYWILPYSRQKVMEWVRYIGATVVSEPA